MFYAFLLLEQTLPILTQTTHDTTTFIVECLADLPIKTEVGLNPLKIDLK
jgi:hypothetical protein